jgi:DNA-directed RNA polymerase subunit RPC12/RpoP
MAATEIVCPMCGFKNPANAARCASCGAKVEEFSTGDVSEEEELARRHQQESFNWAWVFIALSVYLALQAVVLVVLPMAISAFDPQGLPGLLISAGVWFLGGLLIGAISPGRTFMEPVVGAVIAVVPTVWWLNHIADVHQLSMMAYIIGGLLGVMVTVFGAFLGEKIQMGGAKA